MAVQGRNIITPIDMHHINKKKNLKMLLMIVKLMVRSGLGGTDGK